MSEIVVQGLATDSRQVKPGDLFMAIPGLTVDGRDYITQAIEKGAVAILQDVDNLQRDAEKLNDPIKKIPRIPVQHLKSLVGSIAARFFDSPSKSLSVIGVTGTNGKTSTTHFIAQLMTLCKKKCGVIGTLGVGFLGALNETFCTTPEAILIHQTLANLQNESATAVAIEVTSHALVQDRISGVHFKSTIFTNLTRDHLDYHQDMEQYALAKKKLFLEYPAQFNIINIEDPFGLGLFKALRAIGNKPWGYTTLDKLPSTLDPKYIMTTHDLILNSSGIKAWIKTPWGEGQLHSPLLGRFNLSNLLASIAAACLEGLEFSKVLTAVSSVHPVSGRMMRFGGDDKLPLVIVDYAHTPDALEKLLQSVKGHCLGKLWCVFGCGGDRDRGKRPIMAAIGEELSDHVIMTSDNPRSEDPDQILLEMFNGLKNKNNEKIMIEKSRQKAIEQAILKAKSTDVVVIAGKGHETHQLIGQEKIPFSDLKEVQEALRKRETCNH